MATLTDSDRAEVLSALNQLRAGSIRVRKADVEERFDAEGEVHLLVTLVVSEPSPGTLTWPVEEAYGLRQRARRAAGAKAGSATEVAVTITSSGDAETSDEPSDDPSAAEKEADG